MTENFTLGYCSYRYDIHAVLVRNWIKFHIFMPYNLILYFRLAYFHVPNSTVFST